MPQLSSEEAIIEIREGRMVILVDDEDRENEGDLCMAAEKVTPEAINFMPLLVARRGCCPPEWHHLSQSENQAGPLPR